MSLRDELNAFREEYQRTAPPERTALYDQRIKELKTRFQVSSASKVGDEAPDFVLPDVAGADVSLHDMCRRGPVVLVFYRGGWCPYCNLQLRAYQRLLPEFAARGALVVAISPQLPDRSASTLESNSLEFTVLSDAANVVARAFGLVYSLPDDLRKILDSLGKSLPSVNGDDSWELPVPATYVISRDRKIEFARLDVDYRERCEPAAVLEAISRLRDAE
jgi:peroxiredoxin